MRKLLESAAIAFVGRHNSGKTTIACALIAELVARGHDVGSIKHHGHAGFDIDVPGKDSYRHRQAGASETVISAPDAIARIRAVEQQVECSELLATMPGHDVVVVEGYRQSGLPYFEVMRQANERDRTAASELLAGKPPARMVGLISDMPTVLAFARERGMAAFELPDAQDAAAFARFVGELADHVEQFYLRPRVTVALQAGGESTRMGQSKALVDFDGSPLILHMVRRLLPVADELVVTTNEPDELAFLYDELPDAGIRLVRDIFPERGALAGLVTAFEAARSPIVLAVACDMALASPPLLAYQAKLLAETGADAVVPVNRHGFEPLHAAYRRDVCAAQARSLVEGGTMRIRALLDQIQVHAITPAETRLIAPLGGVFANANTPEELEKLKRLFARTLS